MIPLDIVVFRWLNAWAGLNSFLDFLIVFRALYLWYVVMAVVIAFVLVTFFHTFRAYQRRNTELFIVAFLSAAIARFIVTEGIRFLYYRPRPYLSLDGVRVLKHQLFGHMATSSSFPSGHAALAFAVATAVAFYYPKTSILFFAAAFSIGVGRVAVGVHWPSDVLGGAFVGVGTVLLVRWAFNRLRENKRAAG